MNVQHPDMLRQGVPNMHQNLINQPFFPQPQQGQQSPAHNMGPFQNNQGSNPAALGLMGPQPGASNPAYPLNMPPQQQRRPGMFMGTPHANPSGLNPAAPGGAGPSHMAGLAPGQLQNMSAFPGGGMMGQQTIRRVQSQPMNQSGAHMAGMQPGMMPAGMTLNGPPNMGALRAPMSAAQQQQMQLQMRQQQAQQPVQGGAMSPEMGIPMNRPTHAHMQGAGAMAPHARTPSGQAQLMPPGMQQHGMQQQMPHNTFGNPMSLPHQHQHQQSQLGAPQHVGGAGQQQPNMAGTMGGNQLPLQAAANRPQMGPDNNMFMSFQNQLQNQQPIQPPVAHGVPRPPMHNPQFNVGFAASSTPPNQGGEMAQRGNPPMAPSGPTTQGVMTPAQVLDKMSAGGAENFPTGTYGMGQPPVNAPPRPPSQHGPVPHNAFPMPQSQPPHPAPPPQQSPRQADRMAGQMAPPHAGLMQRPQSQPQAQHRQSPIPPGPSRTPRVSHPPLPMNAGGSMMPPGRIPSGSGPGPGQSPQGPSHQQVQPPSSAPPVANHHPNQPMQIAPRPPSANAAAPNVRSAPPAPPQSAPSGQQGPPAENNAPPQQHGQPGQGEQQAPAPTSAPAPGAAPAPPPGMQQPRNPSVYPVGFGQATNRILQFSGSLGVDHKDRLKQSYWTNLLGSYFTDKSTMKLTLWKDNQRSEAKPFEIGSLILPRFFLVTSQSGVKSMSISIDGGRERLVTPSHALVECPNAAWTFQYQNGYNIILRGPLTADVVVQPHPFTPPGSVSSYTLKLERLQFDAFYHDKYIALDAIIGERIAESPRGMPPSPGGANGQAEDPNRFDEARYIIEHAIVPAEPINAFGIPQATMRCLELAESVAQMSELIQFSTDTKLGPIDALHTFARQLREARSLGRAPPLPGIPIHHSEGSSAFDGHGMNGLNDASQTMFMHNNNAAAGPSQGSPRTGQGQSQNTPQSDGSDVKPPKGLNQTQASGSTPSASASTPASAPTPGGPTTPSMANATLKRKAPSGRNGEESPTTANADQQPAAKRAPRKRGRTQGS